MRVRMPVAHKGEWRPKRRRASKTTKAAAGGEFRKNNIEVFFYLYIYIIHIILLNLYSIQRKSARTLRKWSNSQKKVPYQSSKGGV
jgi:hypothetical protein